MDTPELRNRIGDLYNYVQAVRNQLDEIDAAIERLQADVARESWVRELLSHKRNYET